MEAVVEVGDGRVRGREAGGVIVFKGIPYAAPPFGANRLRPPLRAEPWDGVRDALEFGPEPPQLRPDPTWRERNVPGEDCLNLNVWAPKAAKGRPVMVWITGGQFDIGSGGWYDGGTFARDGVVCVSLNYRVGAEGFLDFGGGNANRGLLDQVAALAWVRENIAAFGGDPGNVTVFGESAGAMSIGSLLSMPRAEGLFRRAILESGAAHPVMSAASARRMLGHFAERLGVAPTRDAIASMSVDRVLAAQAKLAAEVYGRPDPSVWGPEVASTMPWQPDVDGHVLPGRPIERIAAGAGKDVEVIVGTNADDWRMFLVLGGAFDKATEASWKGLASLYGLPADAALAGYRERYPGAGPGDLLAAVETDWWVRVPALRLAEAHAKRGGATYMYEFAWQPPELGGRFGACHALEIPFVFDALDTDVLQLRQFRGDHPPQALATAMHAAWIAFARKGDPGWPRYDVRRRATMRFDITPTVVDDPRAPERAMWEGVH